MVTIRAERPVDESAREALLDVAYGDIRHTKPSARLRKGRLPAEGLALVAIERGKMLGTVRLWNVSAGGRDALLLGPLAVHPEARNRGIGSALMQRALSEAAQRGHGAVILVGDESYYGRFGFSATKTGALRLTAACDPARLLAHELVPGAFDGAAGRFRATGRRAPNAALAGLTALAAKAGLKTAVKGRTRLLPRAA
ncbi:MAG: GNAT family N-acetyltransferase [Pseudolabrys sp.]